MIDRVEFDKRKAELVAHRTPDELAHDLLELQARVDSLQGENDRYLFGSTEERNRMHAQTGTEPEPEDVPPPPPAPPVDDDEDVDADDDVDADGAEEDQAEAQTEDDSSPR